MTTLPAKPPASWTETSVLRVRPEGAQALKNDVRIHHPRLHKLTIRFRNRKPVGIYTFYFSFAGKDESIKIGKVGAVPLAFAESETSRFEQMLSRGDNPNVEKLRKIDEHAKLFKDLIEPFLASQKERRRSKRYISDQRKQLEKDFASLHALPVKLIDTAQVIHELDIIKRRGKRTMVLARATLSKFFNWGITRRHCTGNPVAGTETFATGVRDCVLFPEELAIIWKEAGDDEYGRIIKLLMLTAARRSQIGALRTQGEINLAGPWIELQGQISDGELKQLEKVGEVEVESRSKNRQTFLIPLSKQAQTILAQCPRRNGDFMFGGNKVGFDNWDKEMKKLRKRIGDRIKKRWGLHDFRRSFDTLGQDILKIPPHITDACMNHKGQTKQGTRKHYNFAQYLDEKTAAMQAWGNFIEQLALEIEQQPKLLIAAE